MSAGRWLYGFLWALVLAPSAFAVEVKLESGVYVLTQQNFLKAIQNPKYPVMMVKFDDPGRSSTTRGAAMAQKYAKAAMALTKQGATGPRLAKVDATAEKELAEKYEAKTYPTLIVFKDGEVLERYEGPQEKSDIVDYMNSLLLPEAIGRPLRTWYIARGVLKDIILPMTPYPLRRPVRKALPVLVLSPLLVLLCIRCCCCRGSAPPAPKKTDSKAPAGASSSSAGEKKPEEAGKAKARASSPASRKEKTESKKES